jgi:hypothetical protein
MSWHPKANKKGAVRTNGFPSKLENAVNDMLVDWQEKGFISDLRRQHRVEFPCDKCPPEKNCAHTIKWKVDFSYTNPETNATEWAEAKGEEDAKFLKCKRLWKKHGKGPLRVYRGRYRKGRPVEPVLTEVIHPEDEHES